MTQEPPHNPPQTTASPIDIKLSRSLDSLAVAVSLPPGTGHSLESIRVVLDGFLINPERGSRHHRLNHYARHFQQVSQWFPGHDHTLVVTARRQDGLESFATMSWSDLDP
ncbi:hypothetical protein IV102_09345 [bacterium]|nr:hypothetical protein [bacterium]